MNNYCIIVLVFRATVDLSKISLQTSCRSQVFISFLVFFPPVLSPLTVTLFRLLKVQNLYQILELSPAHSAFTHLADLSFSLAKYFPLAWKEKHKGDRYLEKGTGIFEDIYKRSPDRFTMVKERMSSPPMENIQSILQYSMQNNFVKNNKQRPEYYSFL